MSTYKLRNFKVKAEQMTKFDYEQSINPSIFHNPEWKLWDGYRVDWCGWIFWKDTQTFNEMFDKINEDEEG